ncbi:MAG: C45 family peptidase [Bacteroidota bacterium]
MEGADILRVDLSAPPAERWHLSPRQQEQARALLTLYTRELGGVDAFAGFLDDYLALCVPAAYREEMQAMATHLDVSVGEAALGSLYYDAVKAVFGCTAFAVDTPDGPLHARNLDWWTEANLLSTTSMVTEFVGTDGVVRFRSLGWPGFVGVLSGVAPGRFAITLNAVLSDEPAQFAPSIALLIREVLETAPTYAAAVDRLAAEPIASDCLLLVTGCEPGEMVVVERTPTKSARRGPSDGVLAVTNGYRLIDADTTDVRSELLATSCGRYDRAVELVGKTPSATAESCFAVLTDPSVRMSITVQQMVMQARTGRLDVRLPEGG